MSELIRLPVQYRDLEREPGPRLILEALKTVGTIEVPGKGKNPTILAWADEVEQAVSTPYTRWAADWYNDDEVPWCGLWAAVVCVRANPDRRPERMPPDKYLSAMSWASWGLPVAKTDGMLGDIGVKARKGGAHVFTIVGEDATAYHGLGGNTGDKVGVARMPKDQIVAIRRPPYLNLPTNVRKITRAADGKFSDKES